MDIRIATIEDTPKLLSMALEFIKTTKYKYNEETLEKLILDLMSMDKTKAIILMTDDGMIGGVANQFIFGKHNTATEVAWWVSPEKRSSGLGKQLIEAFEYWAKNVAKCDTVTMVALDDKLGKVYEKNGYELYERAYMKEV